MRGQIQQLFIFLAAAVVIVASIFIGMKLFGDVTDTACAANDARFLQDIKATLDENAEFGSRNEVALKPNCKAARLCFVNDSAVGNPGTTVPADYSAPEYAPLVTLIKTPGLRTNIYQYSESQGYVAVGYDERIRTMSGGTTPAPAPFVCIEETGGKFRFRTQGRGLTITISPT